MALPPDAELGTNAGPLSYQDLLQQAIRAGRAGSQKRSEARREAQLNDPIHQQRLKDREEQKRKRAEDAEASKQARKKALKLEAQRQKEEEEARLEEKLRSERERRERARLHLQRKKEALQEKEKEKAILMEKERQERRLKRQQEQEQKDTEMLAITRAQSVQNHTNERSIKQESERRKQAWQRFLAALVCDLTLQELMNNPKKETRHSGAIDKREEALSDAESSDCDQTTASTSQPPVEATDATALTQNDQAIMIHGVQSRDPAVREEATRVIASVLRETQAMAAPSDEVSLAENAAQHCSTHKEVPADALGAGVLVARSDATDNGAVADAAQALEDVVNNVSRSGYRGRLRDLVTALRRAPNAGGDARQLLQDIIYGDADAAIEFASLHPSALLSPSELANRQAIERDALRAATVRLEDEGLPLKEGVDLACPTCGAASPTLQLVGFSRDGECSLHGVHGGVGARRFSAKCAHCLYSWFHMEG